MWLKSSIPNLHFNRSNSCAAPEFYVSRTFQQQNFNKLLSPKPGVGPTLPMMTNKFLLFFFGSRFFYSTLQAYYTNNQLPFVFAHSTKVQDRFWQIIAGFEIKMQIVTSNYCQEKAWWI